MRVWIARNRKKKEAREYAQKILNDNPIILNLVLEDIHEVVDKG